jgi:hypothetical protein
MTSKEALHILGGAYATSMGRMEWKKYRTLKLLSIIEKNIEKGEVLNENEITSIKFYVDEEINNVNNGIFNESNRSAGFQFLLIGVALIPFVIIIYVLREKFALISILFSVIFSICLFRVLASKKVKAIINGAKKSYYTEMLGNMNNVVTEILRQIQQEKMIRSKVK